MRSEFNLNTSMLHANNIGNFKSRTIYWGSKYWSLLNSPQHRWRITDYIVPNAHVMYRLGAEYTLSYTPIHSEGVVYSNGNKRLSKIGSYRCDTFVRSMYGTGGIVGFPSHPNTTYNTLPDIRDGNSQANL